MKIYLCNHQSSQFDILEICKMFHNTKRSLSYLCEHLSVIDYTKIYNSLATMKTVNPHQSPLNEKETFLNDSQIFVKFCEYKDGGNEEEFHDFSCESSHVECRKSQEENLKSNSKEKSKYDFVPQRRIRIVQKTTIIFISIFIIFFSLILIMLTSHHIKLT